MIASRSQEKCQPSFPSHVMSTMTCDRKEAWQRHGKIERTACGWSDRRCNSVARRTHCCAGRIRTGWISAMILGMVTPLGPRHVVYQRRTCGPRARRSSPCRPKASKAAGGSVSLPPARPPSLTLSAATGAAGARRARFFVRGQAARHVW